MCEKDLDSQELGHMKLVNRPSGDKRRHGIRQGVVLSGVALLLLAGLVWWWRAHPGGQNAVGQPPPVPVVVAQAATQDVPIYLDALGTIQAINTVAVHSQIDGMLESVNFTEGQRVKQGDVVAIIDPRPLQAVLDQATAKRAEDQAQLVGAQKDLARIQELVPRAVATQQSLDQQQAKVDQFKATVDADQAAIENAQTQLSYTTIKAPLAGIVGFRQVDAGNVIHANDQTPLTVLTQIEPAVAVFTLPQNNLGDVREAMLHGPVDVVAYDQDNAHQLAAGQLLLIDNQIDQATSTIRLKARFENSDDRLWPGEFVHVHLLVKTLQGALTIPAAAIQRGPQGLYAWVITPANTADQRAVDATSVSIDLAVVKKGLAAGEQVVVTGQSRLEAGTRVAIRNEQGTAPPGPAS
jgi:multidrug efflux system membrane fusion protein